MNGKALLLALFIIIPSFASAVLTEEEIGFYQGVVARWSAGERIAFWAEQFLGTPYDPEPVGEYVRRRVIVWDEQMDCMYLVFRSVELALGSDPADAVRVALDKRFRTRGRLENGEVLNYDERFQYGEDMIESGKWGSEITPLFGETTAISGSRGRKEVLMVSRKALIEAAGSLENGDILFFVKSPVNRTAGEIIGHMGIIKKEADVIHLLHALGRKNGTGAVTKSLLGDYLKTMPFPGVRVTRFEDRPFIPQ